MFACLQPGIDPRPLSLPSPSKTRRRHFCKIPPAEICFLSHALQSHFPCTCVYVNNIPPEKQQRKQGGGIQKLFPGEDCLFVFGTKSHGRRPQGETLTSLLPVFAYANQSKVHLATTRPALASLFFKFKFLHTLAVIILQNTLSLHRYHNHVWTKWTELNSKADEEERREERLKSNPNNKSRNQM